MVIGQVGVAGAPVQPLVGLYQSAFRLGRVLVQNTVENMFANMVEIQLKERNVPFHFAQVQKLIVLYGNKRPIHKLMHYST